MTNPSVTLLIPHYKTLEITQLCLRSLRKFTDPTKAHVIVIDNDSQDESTEYLRSLKWIELIERKSEDDDTPPVAHSRALDIALARVTTPYVLVMHTDSIVKNKKWLDFLIQTLEDHPEAASVGSWKLESKPWFRRLAKWLEQKTQLAWYALVHKKNHAIQGAGKNYYYLRSHCALYRTELLKKHGLTFADERENAGKIMHKKLNELGYSTLFLPSESLGQYLDHLNHATTVLNPALGSRQKSIDQGTQRIRKALKKLNANQLLADESLDY